VEDTAADGNASDGDGDGDGSGAALTAADSAAFSSLSLCIMSCHSDSTCDMPSRS
jgi:hypothetical protein